MSRMLVICHILNIHYLKFLNEVEIVEYNQASVNPIGVGEHYESWKGDKRTSISHPRRFGTVDRQQGKCD